MSADMVIIASSAAVLVGVGASATYFAHSGIIGFGTGMEDVQVEEFVFDRPKLGENSGFRIYTMADATFICRQRMKQEAGDGLVRYRYDELQSGYDQQLEQYNVVYDVYFKSDKFTQTGKPERLKSAFSCVTSKKDNMIISHEMTAPLLVQS